MLPAAYRQFLVAVGLFGAGDSRTLLILLATQKLMPMFARPMEKAGQNPRARVRAHPPALKELLDRFGQQVCV